MIKVEIKQNQDYLIALKISGHAESGEYGHDLVCAGVSASAVGILNMLAEMGFLKRQLGTLEMDNGYVNIVVKQYDHDCQVVLETLVVILKTMVASYGQYIKISIVEV
ncbi:ribosomal-processing cysteine protease Prp [uncultured Thomasclavelia sp.]|uniref:ribosomal-processing cysteine protease Prp n=1 Tax=uncultured Thomasclavelia sp. TaxID=3025759 RepID=UPI0025CB8523|nr:ribosomal-processing cysteine protease Prp [uncultured Thomasclavelia sp.]